MPLAAWDEVKLEVINSECFYRKSFAIFIGSFWVEDFNARFFPFTGYVIEQEKSIAMTWVNYNYNEAIQAGNKNLIACKLLCNAARAVHW